MAVCVIGVGCINACERTKTQPHYEQTQVAMACLRSCVDAIALANRSVGRLVTSRHVAFVLLRSRLAKECQSNGKPQYPM